ncbi:MAG TPA: hypothetical protein VEB21_06115 [Terriglobales bacterium]|nr:hypothetical protein [Terriglobales bacterium]
MRTGKWNAFLSSLCAVAAALGVVVAPSFADVTTEQGSSILIFPKVRASDQFDTIIQITNTGNSMVHAHCNYVNALEDENGDPQWFEIDFNIWLTKQQPTHWVVSTGRRFDPTCDFGDECAGFSPGLVPPHPDFEGELKCVEVDESGAPITGNHLKGIATIKALATVPDESTEGDISVYNAVGIRGNPDVVPGNPLVLDGETYDACPSKTWVNFVAGGATNPFSDDDADVVNSELTLVPCEQDFELQIPESVKIQFLVYNEFEQVFSASLTVDCYLNTVLTDIDSFTTPENSVFSTDVLGSFAAVAIINPVTQTDGSSGGLVGVVEHVYGIGADGAGRAAFNLHTEGSFIPADGPDTIRLAEGF